MERVLYGLAALPLLAGAAMAQPPAQLSDAQMDRVTAGFDFVITETSNTSVVYLSAYQTPSNKIADVFSATACATCYLLIESPALSVGAIMLGSPVHLGP